MNENLKDTEELAQLAAVTGWPLLIHYGSKVFDQNAFKPIKNKTWVKPKGGLWTSPINSKWGWKDWCEMEGFRDCDKNNSFTLQLKDETKVFVIDSFQDLQNAPLITITSGNYKSQFLDFELIAKTFDAIWLTEKGQDETRLTYPLSLYGWDCESVLLLNAKCCIQVEGACR